MLSPLELELGFFFFFFLVRTTKLLSTLIVVWLGLKNPSFHFIFIFWFVDSTKLLLVLKVVQGSVLNPNSSLGPKKDLSLSSCVFFFFLGIAKLLSMLRIAWFSHFFLVGTTELLSTLKVTRLGLNNPSPSLGFFLTQALTQVFGIFFVGTFELLSVLKVLRLKSYNPSSNFVGVLFNPNFNWGCPFSCLFCRHCRLSLGTESSSIGIWKSKLKLGFEIGAKRCLQKNEKKQFELKLVSNFKPKLVSTLRIN